MGANKILEVMNYSYYYDQICAVRELSFHVNEGEVVTLIGSNGAGKTTTLRSISGLIRGGGRGGIKYMGKNIENLPPHRISSMGIAQCLEGRQVFPHLSVKENLQMGAFTRTDKKGISDDFDYVYNLFPRLLEREGQMAGTLSGGEQQMLAVGQDRTAQQDSVRACKQYIEDSGTKEGGTGNHRDEHGTAQVCGPGG